MAVGIAQIERLADKVVGEPDQRHTIADGVVKPPGEVKAFGKQQRDVVEAGVAGARARARLFDEDKEFTSGNTQRHLAVIPLDSP